MCFLALHALHGRSTAGMNPATRENVTGVSNNPWDDIRVEVDRRLDLVLQHHVNPDCREELCQSVEVRFLFFWELMASKTRFLNTRGRRTVSL